MLEDCEKLQFICLADTSNCKDFNSFFFFNAFKSLKSFYYNIFTKQQHLKNELNLIYTNEKLRNISNKEHVCELHEHRDIFAEAYKLVSIIATLSSTSVSVEEVFRAQK